MAALAFEGVTKVFPDGTEAVSHFDLDVGDGELMVLVGPSGSGKSTALRMLAGLEDATAGTIRIGTRVVNDVAPKDRDIAMVFQSYALYPHMDVAHNLGFALRMQRMQRASIGERVGAAARRLGLSELVEKRPRNLSGGQRQRVAVGRAIVREPQAFLMDEPLSNLDAKLRVEMRAYLSRLRHELGTTTVYVTHDQIEAMTMGDRVAVMRDGRLVQCDEPQTLYDRPADLFVAGFMGSPAMNLARARLERTRRRALPGPRIPAHARAGAAPRCGARPRRRAGRGGDPARGDVPRAPRPRRRPGARWPPSSSSSRWAPTCWSMRPSTLRRCSPRTSSKSRARLAETRLPTSCALASPRACAPDVPVDRGRRPAAARRHGAPALLRPRHDARHPVSSSVPERRRSRGDARWVDPAHRASSAGGRVG